MKLELFYPVKPYHRHQKFGDDLACLDIYTGNVLTKSADGVCPAGSIGLYASLGLKGHNGEDLQAGTGQPIYAAHNGVVISVFNDINSGNTIGIKTLEQFDYEGGTAYYKTIYCHLKSFNVKVGDTVKVGDVIGLANSTGKSSGSHLHFGLKPVYLNEDDGVLVNAEQNNGYYGAIDPAHHWNGLYSVDVPILDAALDVSEKIVSSITTAPITNEEKSSLLLSIQKVVELLKYILNL